MTRNCPSPTPFIFSNKRRYCAINSHLYSPLLLFVVSADENSLAGVPMVTGADGAVGVCCWFYRS